MGLSKDKLEKLTDRSTDIVVATDRKGTIVYYNDGAARSLGYAPEEIMGSFVGRLYPSIEEAKRVMALMRGPEAGGVGIADAIQTVYVASDGTHIPVAISGTILYADLEGSAEGVAEGGVDGDAEGEENGSIGYAKDLREILHKDQLATLGAVAIGLSHEINNPLAVILNQAELLEADVYRLAGEADSSVEMERLDAIRREVARVSEIVARLGEMVQQDTYETIDYIGPARMVDLRRKRDDSGPDPRLKGLAVLVVDDDLGIRNTLSEIIEGWGCHVQTAADGHEALACIEAGGVDLVLSDVVMPNMDGHELFLAVQQSHPELPVLMMTAFHYDKDHIIKRSRMQGLSGVIFKKPVDSAKLQKVIVETVGK